MFAVIKTGGKQYLVSVGDKIKIEKIDTADKKEVVFDEVLLVVDDKEEVKIGAPFIKGAKVKAKVLAQDKAKKIIIFKYKAKKRYQKKTGHRQPYTEIEITGISLSTS
ncbi:MAG: 50S ribosomal protein L21 [Candidatus Portnoybacteria bacterium]|nr:50S ribosomal protein L21 [Candidatus Portnoybacteria bacterium]